jgi:hypothetical protein
VESAFAKKSVTKNALIQDHLKHQIMCLVRSLYQFETFFIFLLKNDFQLDHPNTYLNHILSALFIQQNQAFERSNLFITHLNKWV